LVRFPTLLRLSYRFLCSSRDHPGDSQKKQKHLEANAKARRRLIAASCLCALFMTAEVCVRLRFPEFALTSPSLFLQIVGGIYANSLAVLTDAAHLLSDLAGFLISIFALWLASIEPTSVMSFGFHRAGWFRSFVVSLLVISFLVDFPCRGSGRSVEHSSHLVDDGGVGV
jgi:Co/Zn/Cd efflux system component